MKKSLWNIILIIITSLGFKFASAASLNEYWVQGTAASLQTPTNFQINKAGWGAILTIPSATSGIGAWVQVPIAIPTLQTNGRTALFKVMVQHSGTAKITQVDVWDGKRKIASQPVSWVGTATNEVVIPFSPLLMSGVNVSLRVTNKCAAGTVCPKQTMNVVSVGAAFYK